MRQITFFVLVLAGITTLAQEPLSLSDAIVTGLERNYDIQIQEGNELIAENNNSWGETGWVPSINLSVQSQHNVRNQQSDNQFFGGQLFPGFTLDDQRSWNLTPAAQVTWNIFQGGRAVMTKRRLEQMDAESGQNTQVVIANTLQAIILGYYMAVLEKERLQEFKKQLALSRDRYRYVETKVELGSAVSTDLLLEENNYLTDSTNYINQELIYHNALRNLNLLLVSPDINQEYVLTDSLFHEDIAYAYDDLEAAMFSENVDLKRIYISQSILSTQVNINRSDLLPTLAMNAGYQWNRGVSDLTSATYSGPNPDYENPPEPLVSKTGTYFANFTLSFNLFNGGRVNRAIKNSLIQEDIGNIQVDQLKTSLTRDLSEAYERYEIRRRLYGISNQLEQAAQTNLDISSERFRNGSINSFDFRVVQNNYLSASTRKLQALYNLMDSKVELMRLTGGLIERYNE